MRTQTRVTSSCERPTEEITASRVVADLMRSRLPDLDMGNALPRAGPSVVTIHCATPGPASPLVRRGSVGPSGQGPRSSHCAARDRLLARVRRSERVSGYRPEDLAGSPRRVKREILWTRLDPLRTFHRPDQALRGSEQECPRWPRSYQPGHDLVDRSSDGRCQRRES